MTIKEILILNLKLAALTSSGGAGGGEGRREKNTQTISGGMDVLNTARGETEFQHAAGVDVKLFPISGRVWKFNFTAGETISNKHREEKRKRRRRREGGRERGGAKRLIHVSVLMVCLRPRVGAGLRAEGVEKLHH